MSPASQLRFPLYGQGGANCTALCSAFDSVPESRDGMAFQRLPPIFTQGRRHIHVTGCGAQLSNYIAPHRPLQRGKP